MDVVVSVSCRAGTAFADSDPVLSLQCRCSAVHCRDTGTAFADSDPVLSLQCRCGVVHCRDTGMAFADSDLTKYLQCVDNSTANGVSWNDTLGDCQGIVSPTIG